MGGTIRIRAPKRERDPGPKATDPIGVFDSGIGGLTVLRALLKLLPGEDFIYFGDTARVPYGNKSKSTVTRYAMESSLFLLQQGVKAIVVACNTVSATCLDLLSQNFRAPVVGVIEPAARAALSERSPGRIGVIGTSGTIASCAYERELRRIEPGLEIHTAACPLFVPLVEEGFHDHAITDMVVREYLAPLAKRKLDALILACTHYPFLKSAIARYLGPHTRLIDSGPATAIALFEILEERQLSNTRRRGGRVRYYLSDVQPHFTRIGARFLDRAVGEFTVVTL